MADKPGQFKSSHNVSRHTVVIRRARDDDARRIASEEGGADTEEKAGVSSRLTARGAATQRFERRDTGREGEAVASGRQVTVEYAEPGSKRYSTRLVGEKAASVKVSGGDTIIKYKSGDMVIRRGTRRAQLRKQIIWVYALVYLLLFGGYMFFLLTAKYDLTPQEFLSRAFSQRAGTSILDLERAAYEAMRGNRTPAEIRLAQQLVFYDQNKDQIVVEKGSRLTLLTAAKLGQAIIEDETKPADKRTFTAPFKVYKETHLSGVEWPYVMTLYNSIGFFLLLVLFLWRPIMHFLGTQGKKTAVAVENARAAQNQAAEYRNKYRSLSGEIAEKGERLEAELDKRNAAAHDQALEHAKQQAQEITGGVEGALVNAERKHAVDIESTVALAACEQAKRILEKRLGPAEHDAAMDELIADLAGMRLREGN